MTPTEIAGYRTVRLLGAGGMGQVFLVEHPRLPRRDALKLLDSGVSRNDDFRVRFEREADLLSQLAHPNIVTLYDRGEFEGQLWLTMEYVDGTDAAGLVAAHGALHPPLALRLIEGAASALDCAWRKLQLTHRDVKPANLLVGIDRTSADPQIESVKLADFGIAKAAGEATSLTSTGFTVGTMEYISPEAIEGGPVDNRADIYSLGCTAFNLLAGIAPFSGTSIAALMSAHLTKTAPPISEVNPNLPVALNAVFERVLAKNPNDRYQTCTDFVAALHAVLNGGASTPSATTPRQVRPTPSSAQYAPTGSPRARPASQRTGERSPRSSSEHSARRRQSHWRWSSPATCCRTAARSSHRSPRSRTSRPAHRHDQRRHTPRPSPRHRPRRGQSRRVRLSNQIPLRQSVRKSR